MARAGRPFPWKIFNRILLMQSMLVLGAIVASGFASRYFFQRQLLFQMQGRLQDAATLLARTPPGGDVAGWCLENAKGTPFRVVLTAGPGKVLCDSQSGEQGDGAEAVFSRLEAQATAGRPGPTEVVGNAIYGIFPLPGTDYGLRLAAPLTQLSQTLTLFDASLGFFVVLTLAGLGALAVWSARQLVFPLGRLLVKTQNVLSQQPDTVTAEDFQRETFDEWAELESNIDDIRKDLAAKAQSLTREQIELETVMASISDAILAVDPDGNPMFFNSRFEILFGGAGLRKRNLKLWGIFRDPEILEAFTAALKEGRAIGTKAIPLDQEGGLRRYFSLSVSPLRRQDGAVYGALGIFHDVTELKSAEQMRIDFVANVSHELRTPLTVIKGYADTLIEDYKKIGGPTLEYVNSIARNADRLMALMNDLLDLSAIESAGFLLRDPLSTEELTQRALSQLEGELASKEQVVETRFDAPTVSADLQRVEQVLVNLLTNANKYTPQGGKIVVAWENEGSDVLLKVSNNGPGIPLEHQGRLFERFYRIDRSRSRDQGGTGLGLAIVKHIMHRHGGTVWVESNPPQPGATFICRFPGDTGSASSHA